MRATSCLHAALLAALCVLAAGIRPALACSCIRGQSPCQAFASSPIVFVGEVLSSERTGKDFHMRLRVVRALKGITTETADLWSNAETSCGVRLVEGGRYVIYTAMSSGRMSLDACDYWQKLDPGEPGPDLPPVPGRIYGRVVRYDVDRIRTFKSMDPIPSVRIGLDLPAGRVATTSDQRGRFQFDKVPPGKYAFTVDAGQGLTPWVTRDVEMTAQDLCAESQIVLQPSGTVSGQVLTADGKPGSLVYVRLVPEATASTPSMLSQLVDLAQTTRPDGRFTIDGLGPGTYVLAVNPEGADTTARQPYGPTWFGGKDRASATRIHVGEGSAIALDRPFVLQPALATRTFTVAVTCRDGSVPPAISARAATDGARFADLGDGQGATRTLNLMRDETYTLAVSIYVPKGPERPWRGERREEPPLPPMQLAAGAPGRHIALVAPSTNCGER